MAIRTFQLAIDNHPVYGYVPVPNISGTGVLRLKTGVRRVQAAMVAFAEQYSLPHEFLPSSGASLNVLTQSDPTTYAIETAEISPAGATISVLDHASVIYETAPALIPHQGFQLTASSGEFDGLTMLTKEYTAATTLYLITHATAEVRGPLSYFGEGTDVSATYSLDTGTRFLLMTGVTRDDDLAEMIFVDGTQLTGDVYDYHYNYGTGNYQLIYTDDFELHVQFAAPVDTSTSHLRFAVFERTPRPMIRVRENEPFVIDEDGDYGVWIEYFNIPKGDMYFNCWLQ
jgi:hypothetical protein